MAYDSTALSAAIKSSLETNISAMMAAIAAQESGTMLQDFCDTLAGSIVAHLNAHPVKVEIPIGLVVIAAPGGSSNLVPIPCSVEVD